MFSLLFVGTLPILQANPRVETWFRGAEAVISMTHDDNRWDHPLVAAPALTERGFKGTFNVNPGYWSWPQMVGSYSAVAADGHELASHTMKHQYLTIRTPEEDPNNLFFHSLEEIDADCLQARALLDAINNRPSLTFCYPGGRREPEVLDILAGHFISARISSAHLVNPPTPNDLLQLGATTVGNAWEQYWYHYGFAKQQLDLFLSDALSSGGWVIEEYHDIAPPGYSSINLDAYYDHLDELVALVKQNRIWVAPQGDVARYIVERNAAVIQYQQVAPLWVDITVEDGLDDAIYDQPLTVSLTIANQEVKADVLPDGNTTRVILDYPDFDSDGDVDIDDFHIFASCCSGPGIPISSDCTRCDLDGDNDVDQNDFGLFQSRLTH